MSLNFGTSNNNEFSIWDKWKIYYFGCPSTQAHYGNLDGVLPYFFTEMMRGMEGWWVDRNGRVVLTREGEVIGQHERNKVSPTGCLKKNVDLFGNWYNFFIFKESFPNFVCS